MNKLFKKSINNFETLSQREKIATSVILVGVIGALIYFPIVFSIDQTSKLRKSKNRKQEELNEVSSKIARYSSLDEKLKTVEKTFDKAELSFEQVTNEVDRIIKTALSKDFKYDIKKLSVSRLGAEHEKQKYNLVLGELDLQKMVKLLYNFEPGKTPLFVGKITMNRVPRKDRFKTSMEIFSIRYNPINEESYE